MKKMLMGVATAVLCLTIAACGNANEKTVEQGTAANETVETTAQGTAANDAVETTAQGTAANETVETTAQTTDQDQESDDADKPVAKDGADMQTADPEMPTRLPMEGGTKINMHFGDTVIPGVLNDSDTAKALIERLPLTQHVSRYSHDFCGTTDTLPYNEDEVHYGWLNGDIDYAIDAPYFTILFEDEDVSEQYGYQVNIGVIKCPLADIASLQGDFDVRIELAE